MKTTVGVAKKATSREFEEGMENLSQSCKELINQRFLYYFVPKAKN